MEKPNRLKLIIIGLGIVVFLVALAFYSFGSNDDGDSDTETTEQDSSIVAPRPAPAAVEVATAARLYYQYTEGFLPALSEFQTGQMNTYIGTELVSQATGEPYMYVSGTPGVGEMQYVTGKTCGVGAELENGDSDEFAVRVLLEDSSMYCTF